MELLVCEVNAKLLEGVALKNLKAKDVKNPNELLGRL